MPKRSSSPLKDIGTVGKIASGLVFPILAGFFLGNYLDEKFGSAPWITLLLLLMGIGAGFGWLYRSVNSKNNDG